MWAFISDLLKDPERIRAGMEALIEQEQAVNPRDADEQAAAWAKKIAECDQRRGAYQDQQAAGFMTLEELGSKLEGLEETRRTVRAELAALEARKEHVSELKRDRDALLESWTGTVPEALESLTGEERNKVYRMLRLEVTPAPDGYEVTGALSGVLYLGTDGCRRFGTAKITTGSSSVLSLLRTTLSYNWLKSGYSLPFATMQQNLSTMTESSGGVFDPRKL